MKEPRPSSGNALLDLLINDFAVFRDCRPLALGIHKAVVTKVPDNGVAKLRSALKFHTGSTRYLKAIVVGKERFDLDGNPAGVVTDKQREIANTILRERIKRASERRKAENEARRKAQREQEAHQKMQKKLTELMARFNSR